MSSPSAFHMLSYNDRRRALVSSLSPNVSDSSQFPIASILSRLPVLFDDLDPPLLDNSTPSNSLRLAPPTIGLGLDLDFDPSFSHASRPVLPAPNATPSGHRKGTDRKRKYLLSRTVAWWTRFGKRG